MKDEEKVKDEPKIKTVEDLDKKTDIKLVETEMKEAPWQNKYTQLKSDFDKLTQEKTQLQEKYNHALEENNKLFNRLTSTPTQKQEESALDKLLKIKGGK